MKAAVIGAGASGRGFIGRLLYENGAEITFIDKDEALVRELDRRGEFKVSFGAGRPAEYIRGFRALPADCREALEEACRADIIFVSVGFSRLKDLKPFFDKLKGKRLDIVVCENGLSPRDEFLKTVLPDGQTRVTQGVIFCTTIPDGQGKCDILSEKYDELPYDSTRGVRIDLKGFRTEPEFEKLMERKIFTYNCISAAVAYFGYLKGYTDYAKAANDVDINAICCNLKGKLDEVLSGAFGVEINEQKKFSQRAIDKFCDSTISDTITKNARNAARKLSPPERIMGPLSLFKGQNADISILCAMAGAALYYLSREETPEYGGKKYSDMAELFGAINGLERDSEVVKRVEEYYNMCIGGTLLDAVLKM